MITYYTSDTHFGHRNIIDYCQRPFKDVWEMNNRMMQAWRELFTDDSTRLIHAGDFCFYLDKLAGLMVGGLPNAANNVIVLGNHDHGLSGGQRARRQYQQFFGTIIGTRANWRENHFIVDDQVNGWPVKVLVSHLPQRDLRGCDINLYGHVHNNLLNPTARDREHWANNPDGDDRWVLTSVRHVNICVEVNDYRPKTLAQLVQATVPA